ncbi:MAG: arginine--tRNA ligase [bacterium]|nr:arginine--tRNA ligase [bacterium]
MNALEKIKQNIAEVINAALKKKLIKPSDLVYPPNPAFGDISLPCFNLAKELTRLRGQEKTAVETGEFLVGKIELNDTVVAAKAIGPFLNFTFNKVKLAQSVIEEILKNKNKYGLNDIGKNKKVMIEFSNANTHKEYHVGHLRNISYGDAVTKILAANGYKAIPTSYINDFGIHVAKTLWAFNKFYKKEKLPVNKGYFLGKVYVRACKELIDNETAKIETGQVMKNIESRSGADYKLWQKTRKWSIDGFNKIYKELGVKFDHIFYESEVIEKGLNMVAKLYKEEFFIKSQGAVIADLNKYNLGVLVVLRSDGTALYPVADLPLAEEKFKKYKIDRSIYVVDIRQSLYFKQLFKILELLGYTAAKPGTNKKEMLHLGHDFVKLPDGMMSSRTGNVITYDDLRAQAFKKALSETKKRHKKWPDKKIIEVANKLVNGALKFEMLKVGADKVITFDINQALRFDGFTAAYLQYTGARIQSILRKVKAKNSGLIDFKNLAEPKEMELINKLAKYPEIVATAGKNYDPSELTKYLFELAQEFNDYYHSVPVLKAKTDIKRPRLALITAVEQTLKNGLGLLGIEATEEM